MALTCMSTHGGAVWPPGSYSDGSAMICGACGARIEPPAGPPLRKVRVADSPGTAAMLVTIAAVLLFLAVCWMVIQRAQ